MIYYMMYIYSIGFAYVHRTMYISKFAGPLAQGVIDPFLFFVLVCYPPLSPRGLSAPAPGPPGRSLGPLRIVSRVPGALDSSQGDPKDP